MTPSIQVSEEMIGKAVDGLVALHRRLLACFESPTGSPPPRRPHWFEPKMSDCDAALDAAVTLERIKAAMRSKDHSIAGDDVERLAREMFDEVEVRRMRSPHTMPARFEDHREQYIAKARAKLVRLIGDDVQVMNARSIAKHQISIGNEPLGNIINDLCDRIKPIGDDVREALTEARRYVHETITTRARREIMLTKLDAAITAIGSQSIEGECGHCGAIENDHEPSGCCGDGGGSTFSNGVDQ